MAGVRPHDTDRCAQRSQRIKVSSPSLEAEAGAGLDATLGAEVAGPATGPATSPAPLRTPRSHPRQPIVAIARAAKELP